MSQQHCTRAIFRWLPVEINALLTQHVDLPRSSTVVLTIGPILVANIVNEINNIER